MALAHLWIIYFTVNKNFLCTVTPEVWCIHSYQTLTLTCQVEPLVTLQLSYFPVFLTQQFLTAQYCSVLLLCQNHNTWNTTTSSNVFTSNCTCAHVLFLAHFLYVCVCWSVFPSLYNFGDRILPFSHIAMNNLPMLIGISLYDGVPNLWCIFNNGHIFVTPTYCLCCF